MMYLWLSFDEISPFFFSAITHISLICHYGVKNKALYAT